MLSQIPVVTMSVLFGMLIVPLFGQNMRITLFEYPEPMVFSKERHFRRGVKSSLTLLVCTGHNGNHHGNSFSQWEISVHAEDQLRSENHTIPVSSIWIKAKGSPKIRSLGKVFLSTNYQTIAKIKPGVRRLNNALLDIDLKAFDGDNFLKPSGEYTTTIYFTIMMD